MKNFKKLLGLWLVAIMTFSLSACANTSQETESTQNLEASESILQTQTSDNKKIVIGSKPMSEGIIIGEILALLIEDQTDIAVERQFELGATPILHEAIINQEIDIYPEYTGTGWLSILKKEALNDVDELYQEVKSAYEEEFGLTWSPMLGFNNTYTLIVNKSLAEEKNLETISDLAVASDQLIFGANGDFFEREDGFPYIDDQYGMNFKDTKDIDINIKYQALLEDQIQATTAFTTDGYLSEGKVKVLEDDKSIFTAYSAAYILREDVLELYPELTEILAMTENLISDEDMQKMNYAAQVGGKAHEDIAKDYLIEKGLLN